jgi:hypothetical protein
VVLDEHLPTLLAHASTRSCSVDKEPIDAVICLGSSCFARGSAEKLRALNACLEHHNVAVNFRTKGSLCVKEFTSGPTIAIHGVEYGHVQSGTAVALRQRALQKRNSNAEVSVIKPLLQKRTVTAQRISAG